MEHWIFRMVAGDASSDLAKFEEAGKAKTIFDVIAKASTAHVNHLLLVSPTGEVVDQIQGVHSSRRAKEARC